MNVTGLNRGDLLAAELGQNDPVNHGAIVFDASGPLLWNGVLLKVVSVARCPIVGASRMARSSATGSLPFKASARMMRARSLALWNVRSGPCWPMVFRREAPVLELQPPAPRRVRLHSPATQLNFLRCSENGRGLATMRRMKQKGAILAWPPLGIT